MDPQLLLRGGARFTEDDRTALARTVGAFAPSLPTLVGAMLADDPARRPSAMDARDQLRSFAGR